MFKLNRYLSILLLACFLPVVTPREFIHELFGHEDTQDIFHSTPTIEKIHQHCSLLRVTFSTFVPHLQPFLLQKVLNIAFYSLPHFSFIPGISVNLSFLRGPPLSHL